MKAVTQNKINKAIKLLQHYEKLEINFKKDYETSKETESEY
jgi:hypothetical protein